jgi:hypothetical protein
MVLCICDLALDVGERLASRFDRFTLGGNPPNPLKKKELSGPQSHSGHFGDARNVLPLPGIHPQFSRSANTYPCSPAPSELFRVLEVVWTFFTCTLFCLFFLEVLSNVMKLKRHAATGICYDNAITTGFYSNVRGSNLRLEISCSVFLLFTRKCWISVSNGTRPLSII